jgi:hypothetical protein
VAPYRISWHKTPSKYCMNVELHIIRFQLGAIICTVTVPASDLEVNAPEETHLEVVRRVAAVRPAPGRWIGMGAVI